MPPASASAASTAVFRPAGQPTPKARQGRCSTVSAAPPAACAWAAAHASKAALSASKVAWLFQPKTKTGYVFGSLGGADVVANGVAVQRGASAAGVAGNLGQSRSCCAARAGQRCRSVVARPWAGRRGEDAAAGEQQRHQRDNDRPPQHTAIVAAVAVDPAVCWRPLRMPIPTDQSSLDDSRVGIRIPCAASASRERDCRPRPGGEVGRAQAAESGRGRAADNIGRPVPDLRPFRGLRYNPARVPDLSAVLCPPYDVISPSQREQLLARDAHNAVRLELPSATPASATAEDFDTAATTLRQWLDDGTLVRDARPMLYVYEQHYTANDGASRVARSFFAELRLEDYGPDSGVRPHEHTLGPAKEHRFQLLRATRTHLSPVLLIYETDSSALLDELTATPPQVDTTGPDGTRQRLWAIDPATTPAARELVALAGSGPLTIADGHHRYETALRYRDSADAPNGADHVLALLYSAHADGLALAPWHRVITGVPDAAAVLDARRRGLRRPGRRRPHRAHGRNRSIVGSRRAGPVDARGWSPPARGSGACRRIGRRQWLGKCPLAGRCRPVGYSRADDRCK